MEQGKRTKSFSARFSVEVLDKLTEHGRRAGQSSARIAERLMTRACRWRIFPASSSAPVRPDGALAWRADRMCGSSCALKGAVHAGAEDPIEAVSRSTGIDRNRVELAAAIPPPIPTQSTTESASATRRPNACGAR